MEDQQKATSPKVLNKTEILTMLAESTGLSKKQVSEVFDALNSLISQQLREGGPGAFAVPGLMRIKVVRKPATPERQGINPFTKQETVFKAKPARNTVKVAPLKGLKDMVQG